MFLRHINTLEVGIKDIPLTKRYISLPLMVKGHSRENVGTAVKCADLRQKNVRNAKGRCTVVAVMTIVRAIPIMVAQARRAISVAKGHKETGCFKKFPDNALAWYKEKTAKAKSAVSSVEVTLTSLNSEKWELTYQSFLMKTMTRWRYSIRRMCGSATRVLVCM